MQQDLSKTFLAILALPATALGFALSVQISALSWILLTQYNLAVHDIGLVHLSRAKNGIDLAVVNDEEVDTDWIGQEMSFTGFGITGNNADDTGTKRTTEIPVEGYNSQFIESW